MLYSINITEQGKTAISAYDGDSKSLSFFHAVILAKLEGNGNTSMMDLVSSIDEDYPYEMTGTAISDACLLLERQGLITCQRELDLNSKIVVSIGEIIILTSLGSFFIRNGHKLNEEERKRIKSQLQSRTRSFAHIGNLKIEIKLAQKGGEYALANMQTVQCKDCLQVQRVEYDTVSLSSEIPKFCSYCGSERITRTKFDAYWYDLSQSLGFGRSAKGAELTHELYKLWDSAKYNKFVDFVEAMKDETGIEDEVSSTP